MTLPKIPSQMVRGHPCLRFTFSTPLASRSRRIRNEVVIGPRDNGFPGPAVALDRPDAADLSSGVFTILISVTWTKKYKIHWRSTNFCQQLANSDVTKVALNCTASIAADSIVDVIRHMFCDPKK